MSATQILHIPEQSPVQPGCFSEQLAAMDLKDLSRRIELASAADVKRILGLQRRLAPEEFAVLISPAAEPFLQQMVQRSRALTRQRFGQTIGLFVPLYLSNTCSNECTYCGFSISNPIKRRTLKEQDVLNEVRAIRALGFEHILLVTGETSRVGMDYFRRMLPLITPEFSQLSMEVQPLEQAEYAELRQLGLDGVLVYQETYHRQAYLQHHLRGKKADFNYRLDAPDRIGRAGTHKIGLGVLLGLDDWRRDSLLMSFHLRHLQKQYWRSRFSVSFPRIRPHEGDFMPASVISDRQLVQLVAAWRLFDQELELTLSTRESPEFRRHAVHMGFTSLSGEARTQPGGYSDSSEPALEQFARSDERGVAEVAQMIRDQGMDVIWKDWDPAFSTMAL